MSKLISFSLLLAMLFSVWGLTARPVMAESMFNVECAPNGQLANSFSFEQLGYIERILIGPYDTTSLLFSLPANVKLATGSTISLRFSQSWSGGSTAALVQNAIGGTLQVFFNDELIDTILLDSSAQISREIVIPERAFNPVKDDGRHRLQLFLNADVNCDFEDLNTTLLIDKSSSINLVYENVPPLTDLALLPRPIFQPDSILPSKALVVVADDPADYELQAGLTVVAGLGAITEGDLEVNMVTSSQLTQELLTTNHIIFVGEARKLINLQTVNFPLAVGESGVSIDNEQNGVIEIAASPWSDAYVVIFVGGNTREGVVKSSQAFSTGKIIAVQQPDVSIVEQVNLFKDETVGKIDRTFADLGYESQTMGLFGDNFLTYDFYVTQAQAGVTGAYIDLNIAFSELLDFEKTGVTVLLNDEVLGGLRFSEKSPITTRIEVSPELLRRGMNRLELVSDLIPYYSCYATDLTSAWLTVSETSLIHLPVGARIAELGEKNDLSSFPQLVITDKNMNDLAFVLAKDDPESWSVAAKVAHYVGTVGNVPLVSLGAAYGDSVPEAFLNSSHLLIFGRASDLPIISSLGDALPAPFSAGNDEAMQPAMLVNYSLLPDTTVGYLQLLTSPYNPDKSVIAVMGNTQEGVPMAGRMLATQDLVALLGGNFAILYGEQVLTSDTRLGISREPLVGELEVAVTNTPSSGGAAEPTSPGPQPPGGGRPAWILPAFFATAAVLLILLVFALRREARSRFAPDEEVFRRDDQSK